MKYLSLSFILILLSFFLNAQDIKVNNIDFTINTGTIIKSNDFEIYGDNSHIINNAELYLRGDLFIDKNVDYKSSKNSEIIFYGKNSQNIESSGNEFNIITIDNSNTAPNNIFLTSNLIISNRLNLNNGLINTADYSVIFKEDAVSSTGNSNSYISGKIIKEQNSTFIFPAGKVFNNDNLFINSWTPIIITTSEANLVAVKFEAEIPEIIKQSNSEYLYLNNCFEITCEVPYLIEFLPLITSDDESIYSLNDFKIQNLLIGVFENNSETIIKSIPQNYQNIAGNTSAYMISPTSATQYVYNIFSPSNIFTESNENLEVAVYPNPFNNFITIEFAHVNSNPAQLSVINTTGEIVFSKSISGFDNTTLHNIDLSYLPPAVYYLSILSEKQMKHFKIVKQ